MELTKGMTVSIQSYKHNQQIHRVWKNTKIVRQDKNLLLTAHKRTKVIESNGRSWYTKEPALCYFYDNAWFNVIVMFKKEGIFYYCNLSSPYLYDNEAIKYIDYDLDVKVFPNGTYRLLDENEYKFHLDKMNYPIDVQEIIEKEVQDLIKKVKNKEGPFSHEKVIKDFNLAFPNERMKLNEK